MKRMRKKRMEEGLAKNIANKRIKGREGRVTETIRRTRERGNKREDKWVSLQAVTNSLYHDNEPLIQEPRLKQIKPLSLIQMWFLNYAEMKKERRKARENKSKRDK